MEDDSVIHEKPFQTEPGSLPGSSVRVYLYFSSLGVNQAFGMMATLGWAEVLDEFDLIIGVRATCLQSLIEH